MPTPTTMATMPTTPTLPTGHTAMAMLPQPTTMAPSMEDTDTERGPLRLSQRLMLRLSMDPTDTMPSDHTAMAMLPQPTLAMLATDLPTTMAPSMEGTDTERDLLRLSPRLRLRLMLSTDMATLPTLPPMATMPTTPTLPTDPTAMAMLPTDQPTTMVPTLPTTTKKNQD